jgi:hypothetical protein
MIHCNFDDRIQVATPAEAVVLLVASTELPVHALAAGVRDMPRVMVNGVVLEGNVDGITIVKGYFGRKKKRCIKGVRDL